MRIALRVPVLGLALAAALALLAAPPAPPSPPTPPVRHVLRFPAPQTHYLEISSTFPVRPAAASLELSMAVWTPYVIREYARNVEGVAAFDGHGGAALPIAKTRKNRWRVETRGAAAVEVRYRVYCHVMHTQDSWVDEDFAFLHPAGLFLTPVDDYDRVHEIRLELPPTWKTSVTALAPASSQPHHYRADGYEMLTDSPILAGNPTLHEFTVATSRHVLANLGETAGWDGPMSAAGVERIVRENLRMWGSLPYDRYVFLNLITGPGGGMEHTNSTAIATARGATASHERYVRWLGLVSHEYFHLWNVKRLRPRELVPVNYECEQYTDTLGIAEGFTSYYGPLVVRRADLMTDAEYLAGLSRAVRELESTPGHRVQSLAMSSYDTYIKFYRPDENSVNTAISYYTKGEVVAWLLDARIRAASSGRRSLDDVMRLMLERYGLPRGYTLEDFRAVAAEVAGAPLEAWFRAAFDSTGELDYSEALAWFGLRFAPGNERPRAWLGAVTRTENGRTAVAQVLRDSPAWNAGLDPGDQILELDGQALTTGQDWETRLAEKHAGDRASLLILRRGEQRRIETTLGTAPRENWRLEPDPAATPAAQHQFQAWVSPP